MEGDAQFWFQWEDQDNPITRWRDFKMLLLRKFCPYNQGGLVEQWLAVKHEHKIEDYCKNFVEKMTPLSRILVDISLGVFMFGLKEFVSSELRLMDPTNIKIAMEWLKK